MSKMLCFGLVATVFMGCVTVSKHNADLRRSFDMAEIDAIKGQWNYDLLTNDGTKIKGIFQVEPTNQSNLNVAGQAYYDDGQNPLLTENLRGIWTGVLNKDAEQRYVLGFSMKANELSKNPSEVPYVGTIFFERHDGKLVGHFRDHGHREGVAGTVKAYRE